MRLLTSNGYASICEKVLRSLVCSDELPIGHDLYDDCSNDAKTHLFPFSCYPSTYSVACKGMTSILSFPKFCSVVVELHEFVSVTTGTTGKSLY